MKSKPKHPPACPICNQSDMVLPILYGFPSEEMFEQSKKGLIILGGCCIEKDDPDWYCKRDEKGF